MSDEQTRRVKQLAQTNRLLRETELELHDAVLLVGRFRSVELIKDAIGSVEKVLTQEEKGDRVLWSECVWAAADQNERMERAFKKGAYKE